MLAAPAPCASAVVFSASTTFAFVRRALSIRSCAALMPSSAAWRVRVAPFTFSSSCLRSWLSRRYPLTSRRLPCLGGTASALPQEWRTFDEVELINRLDRDYHARFTPCGV